MTRYVVDAGAVLEVAAAGGRVAPGVELVAPTLVRSQVLSRLHEAVARGEVDAKAARERLATFNRMKIRLLGDAVLREHAWKVADRLGWPSTYDAEYVALVQLQADALVTTDPALARAVEGLVTVEPLGALFRS
jgi:indolepyruvate ferredoxin oxidoreductase alpha subunit